MLLSRADIDALPRRSECNRPYRVTSDHARGYVALQCPAHPFDVVFAPEAVFRDDDWYVALLRDTEVPGVTRQSEAP